MGFFEAGNGEMVACFQGRDYNEYRGWFLR